MLTTKLPVIRQFAMQRLLANSNKVAVNGINELIKTSSSKSELMQARSYFSLHSCIKNNPNIRNDGRLPEIRLPSNDLFPQTLFKTNKAELVPVRFKGSYFAKSTSQSDLWKAMTSFSNQGKKRGRAKGGMKVKNLNIGQKLGWGRAKMRFPGLTNPNRRGENLSIEKVSDAEHQQYLEKVIETQQNAAMRRSRFKAKPLERGWAGGNPSGKKFGAPIATNPDLKFNNFESILVQYQGTVKMTGQFGRTRGVRLLMCTGNKNGTIGYAHTQEAFGRGMYIYTRAANRAGLRLFTIPRYENRTVYHDFFSNFGQTRVMVLQKPNGYGVKAHRLIKSVCELAGIKDLAVKVEGSMNYNHLLKAFLLGLLRQRTHQELANEMRLHLVEFRPEVHNFPKVVASPEDGYVRTKEEIRPDETLDFQVISFDGNKPLFKPKPRPFYERLPSWQQRLKKVKPQEHHFQSRIEMLVEHGREQSQYTDLFPECKSVTEQTIEWGHKKNRERRNSDL